MRALPVTVEDRQDLGHAAVRADRVRNHRGELGGVARIHQDRPLPQLEPCRPREHREPVASRVHAELVHRHRSRRRHAHLRDERARAAAAAAREDPHRAPRLGVRLRADHDVGVVARLDERVERRLEGLRDGHQLVERDAPMTGLDAAERRRAEEAAGGQRVERPAAGLTQAPDALADEGVEVGLLRHEQDRMRQEQECASLDP
ncbi:hypothetical protein ABID70_000484 [Clavibacter michiganensis]